MPKHRWLLAASAGLAVAAFGPTETLAQQGPPDLPPGLHDRALPPGKPFDLGGFDPPGRRDGGGPPSEAPPGEAVSGGDTPQAENGAPSPGEGLEPGGAATRWAVPGMAASTPHGYGARFGDIWAGASYQPRARRSDGPTGAAAVGFGLGNPERYLGMQVGVNSYSTVSSGFWNRAGLDVQVHRLLPGDIGLAVGWEGITNWGRKDVTRMHSGSNRYAVASRWFQLRPTDRDAFSAVMLSVGAGDGRFQSEKAFLEERDGVGVFGSAAVRVAAPVSVIAEWNGQDVMLATSITPLRDHRVAITAGVADVTGTAGDGARFAVGFSAAYNFLDW